MTEYGRGPGSEPWQPDDPLYGDQGWSGGNGWDSYGGGQAASPHVQQPQQPYPDPQYGEQQYAEQQYTDQQYYAQPQPNGWGETTGDVYGSATPYGHPTPAPHDGGASYGAGAVYDQTAAYDLSGSYAPPTRYDQSPQPTSYDQTAQYDAATTYEQTAPYAPPAAPAPHPGHDAPPAAAPRRGPVRHEAGPDPETGWDPGPDQGEKDFFSRGDDEDDEDDRRPGGPRGRRASAGADRPKRSRGGCGCLVLATILVGGVVGTGFYGYQLYQDRFGPAPDYAGEGSGEIQVEIPEGATSSDIGNILREADVVKSHDAFVEAATANEEAARSIQPGVYSLRLQMSADSALEMLTNPAALNVLTVPEGLRATQVYALIDERLGLAEGTTEDVAAEADLGLPDWADGNIEGFLFPHRYDVGGETTPEDLLTAMVDRAEEEFASIDLANEAESLGMTPYEVLTVASLIQAEAQEPEDFGKVSRVIYNRLDTPMQLEFDSTINYAMGRSTLDTSIEDTQYDSPYNTYVHDGLPPGPIDNPGHQALEAALDPTEGPWLYFVTVSEGDTRFTDDYDEHLQNVADFNAQQGGD
ncbi:endolytic transglycosylase MltG [Streptomyces sp. 4N509B]|uniref:endolytic transglycosylase MltG n=1 Tax=Streptomyces sp. 4N509B TaxID=3457413 RepID=UPI003FD48A85